MNEFYDAMVKCTNPTEVITIYETYRDRTPWLLGNDGAWYCRLRSSEPVEGLTVVAEGNEPYHIGTRPVTIDGVTTEVAVVVGVFA